MPHYQGLPWLVDPPSRKQRAGMHGNPDRVLLRLFPTRPSHVRYLGTKVVFLVVAGKGIDLAWTHNAGNHEPKAKLVDRMRRYEMPILLQLQDEC